MITNDELFEGNLRDDKKETPQKYTPTNDYDSEVTEAMKKQNIRRQLKEY